MSPEPLLSVHTYKASTQEAEGRELVRVEGPLGWQRCGGGYSEGLGGKETREKAGESL